LLLYNEGVGASATAAERSELDADPMMLNQEKEKRES